MTFALRPGPVDVHAHWLPSELFGLPPGAPFGGIHDHDGQLFIGETPLSIKATLMSDVAAIRDDMTTSRIGARALSAPPFAFAVSDQPGTDAYVEAYNTALAAVVAENDGWFAGFGLVNLTNPASARRQAETIAATEGLVGIALPPVHGPTSTSLDADPLRSVLRLAVELDLAVLVHPMQLPQPTLTKHYLVNLIGNPVETATAVASLLLGGVLDELPKLRICFVHGAGCAPDLLGRWTHAWSKRPDVHAGSPVSPMEGFRHVYADTVTHDDDAFRLLATKAGDDLIVLGSDYPFDMAETDPVGNAERRGLDLERAAASARTFLGL